MRGTHHCPTNTQDKALMLNQIRNFGYTMKNPIPRKIFFLYHFAPKRYSEFCDLMYTLNTELHQGTISVAEHNSTLLAF